MPDWARPHSIDETFLSWHCIIASCELVIDLESNLKYHLSVIFWMLVSFFIFFV